MPVLEPGVSLVLCNLTMEPSLSPTQQLLCFFLPALCTFLLTLVMCCCITSFKLYFLYEVVNSLKKTVTNLPYSPPCAPRGLHSAGGQDFLGTSSFCSVVPFVQLPLPSCCHGLVSSDRGGHPWLLWGIWPCCLSLYSFFPLISLQTAVTSCLLPGLPMRKSLPCNPTTQFLAYSTCLGNIHEM